MPQDVFSAARFRRYQLLDEAGIGDAVELQILERVLAGKLWLPLSLAEIGFRNAADHVLRTYHPLGANWLFDYAPAGPQLIVGETRGHDLVRSLRSDGSTDDKVAEAARSAGLHLGRTTLSRDDVIANLMLGFWVAHAPVALPPTDCGSLWELIAVGRPVPFDNARKLQRAFDSAAYLRNRVAHHEPLLFRNKHVTEDRGDKVGLQLVGSLESAIQAFRIDATKTVDLAKAFCPMAVQRLDGLLQEVDAALGPLEERIADRRGQLAEARAKRKASMRGQSPVAWAPPPENRPSGES